MGSGHGRIAAILGGPPVTWVMTGDSITQAHNTTDGRRGYAELFAEHLRGHMRMERVRDAVVNTGVSGSTVAQALPEFHWRISRFSPDVVSIAFGMNDCADGPDAVGHFAFHLHQLVSRSLDTGAAVILHTPYPVGPGDDGDHGALPAYAEAIRKLGDDQRVPVVDHFTCWSAQPQRTTWYLDPWHANARGHVEMARLFVRTFDAGGDVGWLDDLAATLDRRTAASS